MSFEHNVHSMSFVIIEILSKSTVIKVLSFNEFILTVVYIYNMSNYSMFTSCV